MLPFVLTALIGLAPPTSSVDVTVTVGETSLVVTARPPEGRTVRTIEVQPAPGRVGIDPIPKPLAPNTTTKLRRHGVRATFDRPSGVFRVVVILDDNSVYHWNSAYIVTPGSR